MAVVPYQPAPESKMPSPEAFTINMGDEHFQQTQQLLYDEVKIH